MHVQIVRASIKVRVVQIFLGSGKKILKSILLVVHSHLTKKKKLLLKTFQSMSLKGRKGHLAFLGTPF